MSITRRVNLGPIFRRLDNAILQINHFPADKSNKIYWLID